MPFQRIGVFITTDGGPVNPPPFSEPFTKVVAPVGSSTSVPFDFDKEVQGAWFTTVDSFPNVPLFHQVLTGKPSGNRVNLHVAAKERGASLLGFINALIV